MKHSKPLKVTSIAAIAMLALGLYGFGEPRRLQIGDTMPKVMVTDFHGKSMTLPQDLKGKVALLRFWAIDCTQCSKELLFSLESLYQKYKDQGFIPVAIHEGRPEGCEEKLRKFDSLSFPMLRDDLRTVALRFGLIGLPTTYIIDGKGVVREKVIGDAAIDEYERLVVSVFRKR
jgi:cytochrome c biogenesis protein CcmG, thiol:disulfide interchange protein DsbE